jgi:hypothetical protein
VAGLDASGRPKQEKRHERKYKDKRPSQCEKALMMMHQSMAVLKMVVVVLVAKTRLAVNVELDGFRRRRIEEMAEIVRENDQSE